MKYRPLTLEERYTIATMKQAGHAHREIARVVGRPPSTIGREVRRNRSSKGDDHRSAHALARSRRRGKATITFDAAMQAQAEAKLQAGWSPEPITGRFKALGLPMVSHQRLYQHIRQDQALGGSLHRFLRRDGKRRKKHEVFIERKSRVKKAGVALDSLIRDISEQEAQRQCPIQIRRSSVSRSAPGRKPPPSTRPWRRGESTKPGGMRRWQR